MSDVTTLECESCGIEHDQWEKTGEHAIGGKHHSGTGTEWTCGRCGHVMVFAQR